MKRFLAVFGLCFIFVSCGGGSNPPVDKWLEGDYSILYSPVTEGGDYSIALSDDGSGTATGTSAQATITVAYTGTYVCQSVTIEVEGTDPSVCTTCEIGENGTHLGITDCAIPDSPTPVTMDLYKAPGTNALTGEYVGTVGEGEVTLEMSEKNAAGVAATTGGVYSSGTASYEDRGFVVAFSTDYATCNAYFEDDDGSLVTCSSCDIPDGTGNSIAAQCADWPAPVEFRKPIDGKLSGDYGLVYAPEGQIDFNRKLTLADAGLGTATGTIQGAVPVVITYPYPNYTSCTATVGGTDVTCEIAVNGDNYDLTLSDVSIDAVDYTVYASYLPSGNGGLTGNYDAGDFGVFAMTETVADAKSTGNNGGAISLIIYYSTGYSHCNLIGDDGNGASMCVSCTIPGATGDTVTGTCGGNPVTMTKQ